MGECLSGAHTCTVIEPLLMNLYMYILHTLLIHIVNEPLSAEIFFVQVMQGETT